MVSRKEMRRRLLQARFGSFSEWHQACCEARDAGWQIHEIDWIINLPIYVGLASIVLIFAIGAALDFLFR